jgi:ABC-2 type transport system permease protein
MPAGFKAILKISPMHWSLDAYYHSLLQGDGYIGLLPDFGRLLLFCLAMQILILWKLKKEKLL